LAHNYRREAEAAEAKAAEDNGMATAA